MTHPVTPPLPESFTSEINGPWNTDRYCVTCGKPTPLSDAVECVSCALTEEPEPSPGHPICEECDDARATTSAWFNGKTLVNLCADCWAWWENHGLIEERT